MMVPVDAGNQAGIYMVGAQIMVGIEIRCPIDQEKNNAKTYSYDGQFQVFHGSSQVRKCDSVKRVNQHVSSSRVFYNYLRVECNTNNQ